MASHSQGPEKVAGGHWEGPLSCSHHLQEAPKGQQPRVWGGSLHAPGKSKDPKGDSFLRFHNFQEILFQLYT